MKLFGHFNEHAFFQTPCFHPLPTASILSLIGQGGPIKPKVVTSTKDDKRKPKKIDAEKIVLDGGEVRAGKGSSVGVVDVVGVVGWK